MIDCIVTTTGAIEEDIIKCMSNFYMGSFEADDKLLRKNAINRTGNLMVPSDCYV